MSNYFSADHEWRRCHALRTLSEPTSVVRGSCSCRRLGQLAGVQVFIHSANTYYYCLLGTVSYPEDTDIEEHKHFCVGFCILKGKENAEKK